MPSAIETMKRELVKIQQAQDTCLDFHGRIKPCHTGRYHILVEKAHEFRESIKWMEANTFNIINEVGL
ncbi:hypothetical protein KAR91_35215 [Candidatus Pacearchaeota archaeon]|nr:hypothetical protein [Candidatus Pacearchaeota archaeon]